jgi:hypothetical protein
MCKKHLVPGFPEILQHMKTVCDLRGSRGTLACTLRIRTRPIPRDDLPPGVLPQPLRHRLGGALREQGYRLPAFQVHQDRAIGVPFAQDEIVPPSTLGLGNDGVGCLRSRRGVFRLTTRGPLVAEVYAGLAPEGDTKGDQALGKPQGTPSPGGRHRREPFGEDAPHAVGSDKTICGHVAGGARDTAPTADRSVCADKNCGGAAPGWGSAGRSIGGGRKSACNDAGCA